MSTPRGRLNGRTKNICKVLVSFMGPLVLLLAPSLVPAQMAPALPPEKTVEVLGQKIRYHETGQGPNLIFLHGLGSNSAIWAANIGPLSAKYHVYAVDQIGFGRSDKPLIDYKIETFVEFLQGFMQAAGIPKASLVGNSLGGWIAADFAAQHPAMVDKLVLVDAAGMRPVGGMTKLAVDLNPSSLAGMRQILEYIVYDKQFVTDALVRHAFEEHLRDGDGYTIERTLAGAFSTDQFEDEKARTIHAPTLVLWGHEDALIPLSSAERFQKTIPGSKLVVLNQCGHVPEIEKPQEFNQALLDFLGSP
ncbi:MAG TPA: alpha/beta hydrolase [Terriglobia bacterium]|nr:alpha/beta hydrolase [Terriglobia bacterium]